MTVTGTGQVSIMSLRLIAITNWAHYFVPCNFNADGVKILDYPRGSQDAVTAGGSIAGGQLQGQSYAGQSLFLYYHRIGVN